MKAQDYIDKYYELLIEAPNESKQNEVIALIIKAFGLELLEIFVKRKASSNRAMVSLIKEQNQKYNKFCRLVNERCGVKFLKEDGLKNYWMLNFPTIKKLLI